MGENQCTVVNLPPFTEWSDSTGSLGGPSLSSCVTLSTKVGTGVGTRVVHTASGGGVDLEPQWILTSPAEVGSRTPERVTEWRVLSRTTRKEEGKETRTHGRKSFAGDPHTHVTPEISLLFVYSECRPPGRIQGSLYLVPPTHLDPS